MQTLIKLYHNIHYKIIYIIQVNLLFTLNNLKLKIQDVDIEYEIYYVYF